MHFELQAARNPILKCIVVVLIQPKILSFIIKRKLINFFLQPLKLFCKLVGNQMRSLEIFLTFFVVREKCLFFRNKGWNKYSTLIKLSFRWATYNRDFDYLSSYSDVIS